MVKIRVLVVDDSALVRGLLKEIINRQSDMECIGGACDPLVARAMIRELDPDVVTLDIEMPRMDGLDFLGRLMRLRPTPVVMVSTLTEAGASVTLKALELGAVDFLPKPRFDLKVGVDAFSTLLVEKIKIAAGAKIRRRLPVPPASSVESSSRAVTTRVGSPLLRDDVIVFIGASTGGTEAIKAILSYLPANFPPILVTQHMPPGFTASFAARLNDACLLHVKEASDAERVLAGHVYIAPGGRHLSVQRCAGGVMTLVSDGPTINRHKPSVEVLFQSAAEQIGANAIGVMLTGMGEDGARAMREMKDAGSYNIVQDAHSCVVFGMPREAIANGAADEILPLSDIAQALIKRAGASRTPADQRINLQKTLKQSAKVSKGVS